jgi:TatD DNase family protein
MLLFDSHAHIESDALVHATLTSDVAYVIDVGYDVSSSRRAAANAARYPWCFAAVGIHPLYIAESITNGAVHQNALSDVEALARQVGVKAIGEIGLDDHQVTESKAAQQEMFRRQIRLALKLKLPVTIHDRGSHGDVMDILIEEGAFGAARKDAFPKNPQTNTADARVLLHAYSGSAEQALQYVKLGATISIAGSVTYGNNRKAVAVAEAVPLAHLLIETDAPFLTPEPFRGSPNAPPLLKYTAEKIAEIKGISAEALAAATLENGKRFFDI